MNIRWIQVLLLIIIAGALTSPVSAQAKKPQAAAEGAEPAAQGDQEIELTLPEFIQRYINNNLALRNSKYDSVQADTALKQFQGQYGWNLVVTGAKEYQTSTEDISAEVYAEDGSTFNLGSLSALFGGAADGNPNEINGGSRSTSYTETDEGSVSLSKAFSTGTNLSTGFQSTITETDGRSIGVTDERSGSTYGNAATITQDFYGGINRRRSDTTTIQGGRWSLSQQKQRQIVPTFFISLEQELLRNVFGRKDRLDRKIIKKQVAQARANLDEGVSASVANAINLYWQLEISRINLQIARTSLTALRRVRNITARKVGIGLSENYELNQWNSRLNTARIQLESSELQYAQALRAIAREINMQGKVRVTHKGVLRSEEPDVTLADAQANALKYRADYRNAQRDKAIAEMQRSAATQGLLPSLQLNMDAYSSGLDGRWGEAFDQAGSGRNPRYRVELQLQVPLWREDLMVERRDASLNRMRASNDMERIKREVMDDVRDKHDTAAMQHRHLKLNRRARIEMEAYYNRLIRQSTLGRVGSVTLYDALTSYLDAYRAEQESLVNYNIALLNLSLAQNTLFTDLRVRFPELRQYIDDESAEEKY